MNIAMTIGDRVTVVVATRNRRDTLRRTLCRLVALDVPIVVVDNGSSDGTAESVHVEHPAVRVCALGANLGAAARNVGAELATTPYVAFADDDSWWDTQSLAAACSLFDAHAALGLVAARVLVGASERLDPTSALMAHSPLGPSVVPGSRRILGFLACAAVTRRDAFLAAGGFSPRLLIGGEEALLAIDLRSHGWELAYAPNVVAYHHPQEGRDLDARDHRACITVRNACWTAWLRYPPRLALRATADAVRQAAREAAARRGLLEALRGGLWAVRHRRRVPAHVRGELMCLHGCGARRRTAPRALLRTRRARQP